MESKLNRITFASYLTPEQFRSLCDNFESLDLQKLEDYYFDFNSVLYKKNAMLEVRKFKKGTENDQFKISLKIGNVSKKLHYIHSPFFTEERNVLFSKGLVPDGDLKNHLKSLFRIHSTEPMLPVSYIGKVVTNRYSHAVEDDDDFILNLNEVKFPGNVTKFILKVEAKPEKEKYALLYCSKLIEPYTICPIEPITNYKDLVKILKKINRSSLHA
jgi:hypothetical protein